MAVDGRPRPGDARVPAGRRGRLRLRQQPARAGPGGRRRGRVRLPGLRAGVHPAAVLRGPRPVPLGRAVAATRPTSLRTDRGDPRAVPRRRRPPPLDRDGRGAGSRSRACRPGSAGSATASGRGPASRSTSWSRTGEVSAPIVIGRDHLDAGSVASPNRETEAMRDGSDAIADWPLLNALVNTAAGATWVSDPPRRRRRDRLQPARRDGRRRRRHASWRRRSWSASSRPIRRWASSATSTPATSGRSRSRASAASASRCSSRAPRSGQAGGGLGCGLAGSWIGPDRAAPSTMTGPAGRRTRPRIAPTQIVAWTPITLATGPRRSAIRSGSCPRRGTASWRSSGRASGPG